MGTAEAALRRHHIVMLPFLAQGHLIPFLALARQILHRYPGRFAVTLVSTPRNVRSLRSTLPPDSGVLLRELPFNSADHGLPPDAENTDSLKYDLMLPLFQASGSLRPHFERLVADDIVAGQDGRPPLSIIGDLFMSWSVHVAKQLGVFHAVFTTFGSFGTAAYFSLWQHLPHVHTAAEEDEFGVPGFPETYRLCRSQTSRALKTAKPGDPWVVFMCDLTTHYYSSNAMLCNTVKELEPAGTALLQKKTGLLVWTIGPMGLAGRRPGKAPGIDPEACTQWLDAHPVRSVIYVSFGSQNSISAPQMVQLAMGLEASGRPFIWVVRPPFEFDVREEFRAEWLPEGFEERMRKSGRGLVVRNWAPQPEILSHESVGAFLSHCGWNSVLESLGRGVPLVGWPLSAEQFYNVKMLAEELGVCVELARGVDQHLDGAEVERVVGLVMGEEKGADMRRKATLAAETIRAATREEGEEKGSSLAALDDFLGAVLRESPVLLQATASHPGAQEVAERHVG